MKKTIIILLLFNVIIVFTCANTIFTFNDNSVEKMTDVSNLKLDNVINKYKKYELEIEYIDSSKSENIVLYSYPSKDSLLIEGQKIKLYVSKGIEVFYYKSLLFKSFEDNYEYIYSLEKHGVHVVVINQIDNDLPDGIIVSQSMSGIIKNGDQLEIVVNYNEPLLKIDSFIGLSEADVLNKIYNYNIDVKLIYNENKGIKGLVYYQSIPCNSLVLNNRNTILFIYISI